MQVVPLPEPPFGDPLIAYLSEIALLLCAQPRDRHQDERNRAPDGYHYPPGIHERRLSCFAPKVTLTRLQGSLKLFGDMEAHQFERALMRADQEQQEEGQGSGKRRKGRVHA